MRVVIQIIIVYVSCIYLTGCDYLLGSLSRDVEYLQFNTVNGTQSDINYQRFDVFNDYESYSIFLSQLSSYDATLPEFNAETQTLISVILFVNPCSFMPEVFAVTKETFFDGGSKTLINVKNNKVNNVECDSSAPKKYNVNFVTIEKTNDKISLFVRNDNY